MLPFVNPLKHNDFLHPDDSPMRGFLQARTVLFLTGMLLAVCWSGSVPADELPPASTPDEEAARLVEDVLRKAGGNDGESLGDWARDVVERALGRAGAAARQTVPGSRLGGRDRSGGAGPGLRAGGAGPGAPGHPTTLLPAERHAVGITGGAAGRAGTAEVLIFTSLSVPAASWRQWAHEAARTGAPLVLRGVGEGGLRATVKEIGARIGSGAGARIGSGAGARLGGAEAGAAIDPRLFRLFGVTRVPAVVVVPGGVPPCTSRGCANDPPPPHDRITGNVGLTAALEAVAGEGDVARAVARRHLQRLQGEDRP